MLRLENIRKIYQTGDMKVEALKGVSLSFRKSEFVSILGPSGCGKTTLLNIIGGLDKYTDGDLIIDGKNTKDFNDKDWDIYRNNHIGFVFQSYNLIPHQSILGNVELALTIAGVSKEEKQRKAKEALDKVGLKGMYNKKPNQLSGGQCQRVAIARALVNEPEVLLADEPTGALDTETSIQIMELIKEISKEKLVIMVTHNPELAYKYSTRIVKVLDGNVIDDSNPFSREDEINEVENAKNNLPEDHKKKQKTKMSFFNSFKLSLKNLWSKRRRTILTCFAGSIGIIGVSSVLAVSNGVTGYIDYMQDDMLSGNPITIEKSGIDLASITKNMSFMDKADAIIKNGVVNVNSLIQYVASLVDEEGGTLINNNITPEYIEYIKDMPKEYYNAISLRYGVNLSNNIFTSYTDSIYDEDNDKMVPRTREISVSGINSIYTSVLGSTQFGDYAQMITALTSPLMQTLPNEEFLLSQYDVKEGRIAKEANEMMIVINSEQELADLILAQLGYYTQDEFIDMAINYKNEDYKPKLEFTFEELMNKKFTYYPNNEVIKSVDFKTIADELNKLANLPFINEDLKKQIRSLADYFGKASPFTYRSENTEVNRETIKRFLLSQGMDDKQAESLIKLLEKYIPQFSKFSNGEELKVVGILMPKPDRLYTSLSTGFYYTEKLVDKFLTDSANSDVVKYALENADEHGNYVFGVQNMETKEMSQHIPHFYEYTPWLDPNVPEQKPNSTNTKGTGMSILLPNAPNSMNDMINSMIGGKQTSLGPEVRELGGKSIPSGIWIYPLNFDDKGLVTSYLDRWNNEGDITLSNGTLIPFTDRSKITYQDNLQMVIEMINTMVNIVTIALICFTSLSLVVSCVMIAIITYVSVMERIKEIGIIRALGGRKRDVSNLFNAETIIIGTISGVLGIGITLILQLIVNPIVAKFVGFSPIANLQWYVALIMLAVSVLLTTLSGFIPAHSASKKDPVVALRTE